MDGLLIYLIVVGLMLGVPISIMVWCDALEKLGYRKPR